MRAPHIFPPLLLSSAVLAASSDEGTCTTATHAGTVQVACATVTLDPSHTSDALPTATNERKWIWFPGPINATRRTEAVRKVELERRAGSWFGGFMTGFLGAGVVVSVVFGGLAACL
ncbi:hypothetical protein BKA63DRAFT_314295 [Paraphoma chrysanthemicola]|nr:hypothetical protein BKA63DRAFT_314295 [Paraphoma chrysanthemicola]